MTHDRIVTQVAQAADLLDEAGRRLPAADPGPTAFGAGALGLLGELGRDAYARWQAGLDARAREALAHAARLRDLADDVGRAVGGLAGAHEDAQQPYRDQEGGQ